MISNRAGFILPIVLTLLAILVVLGAGYLSSTIQSKNVFQVFYRDDLARLIAESTVSEWRATFSERLARDSKLSAFLKNPKHSPSEKIEIKPEDVPKTAQMGRRLLGASQFELTGFISIKDIDNRFEEKVDNQSKVSAYGNEYQGSLRFEITVGLGESRERKFSCFVFEFDVKNACLRTDPGKRLKGQYSNNACNDYVLFVRNGRAEFDKTAAASINNDRRQLKIVRTHDKGKIFCGTSPGSGVGRSEMFVFCNVTEGMEFLLPPAPPDIEIPWSELKELMPVTCQEIENIVNTGGGGMIQAEKLKGVITREFTCISGSETWLKSQREWTQKMMEEYFRKVGNKREGNKEKCIDFWSGLDRGAAEWPFLEGNIRKRFWQNSIFRIDFTDATQDPMIIEMIKKVSEGKAQREIPYYETIDQGILTTPTSDEKTKELLRLVKRYQEKTKSILMSQANDQYSFVPGHANQEQNSPGRDPTPAFFGRMGPVDAMEYLPYATFLLRSFRFKDDKELYDSPFFDVESQTLKVDGIMLFEDPTVGVSVWDNLKYRGEGVLLSYGPIRVQGSFTRDPKDPTTGPCVLYTFRNDIFCNVGAAGRVQASLIAMNFRNVPGNNNSASKVHFGNKPANVLGNLVADNVNLNSMQDSDNQIAYDDEALSGDDLYHLTFGGRLRLMSCAYNMSK